MTKISPDAKEMNELWKKAQEGKKEEQPKPRPVLRERSQELTPEEKKTIEKRWTDLYNKK